MNFLKKNALNITIGIALGILTAIGYANNLKEQSTIIVETEQEPVIELSEPEIPDVVIYSEPFERFDVVNKSTSEEDDGFQYVESIPLDEDTQKLVYDICEEYEVPFFLVLSLIDHESDCEPDVISSTGDYGLCQINKINHGWLEEDYGITDIMDVKQNVTACCIILKDLFDKYEDEHKVLMAYNMGEGGAKKCWKKGKFTSNYSREIIKVKEGIENDNRTYTN